MASGVLVELCPKPNQIRKVGLEGGSQNWEMDTGQANKKENKPPPPRYAP